MSELVRNLVGVWRGARRQPVFSLTVLLTLALGSGAALAVWSLLDGVLLRPLPYPGSERLIGLWFESPNFPGGLSRVRQSIGTFIHFRDRSRTLEAMALAEQTAVTLDQRNDPVRVAAAVVTPEITRVLGIAPVLGRSFGAEDNAPGAEPTAVIGTGLWAGRYGRDPAVVGQSLEVDGVSRRIIGVLPAVDRFPVDGTTIWLPLEVDPTRPATGFIYTGYARVAAGASAGDIRTDLERVLALLPEAYPQIFPQALFDRLKISVHQVPLHEETVGAVRQPLLIVALAMGVLLLVVVANAVTLFLVRSEWRRHDLAVRLAAGAGLPRVTAALLVEGFAYSLTAGALGFGIAAGLLRWLRGLDAGLIPRLAEVGLDGRAVGFGIAVAAGSGLVLGLVPALRLRGFDVAGTLRIGGRSVSGSRAAVRLRSALVAGQVAAAVVLLSGAAVLVRSFAALRNVDPGFTADQVLGARLFAAPTEFPAFADVRRFYLETIDRTRALAGVEAAGGVSFLPLRDGRIFYPYETEGAGPDELPNPRLTKIVTDGYLEAMRIGVVGGRSFTRDDLEQASDAVIVNTAFAAAHWGSVDVIGKRIRQSGSGGGQAGNWLTVVGVVQAVRDRDLRTAAAPIVYLPMQERHATDRRWRELSIAIRAPNPAAVSGPFRAVVRAVNRAVPVTDVRTMAQAVSDATGRDRYAMQLLLFSALATLFLAAVGLYGLMAFVVAGRRRELGLRLALGATPAELRGLVFRQALRLTALGGLIGVVASALGRGWLRALVYGASRADLLAPAAAAVALGAVAVVAAWSPARRAGSVAPIVALQEE
ncbi:MAG: ADOP family duplicated permease [Gemmatimonadales bacterium]